jgi:hypothetical protein
MIVCYMKSLVLSLLLASFAGWLVLACDRGSLLLQEANASLSRGDYDGALFRVDQFIKSHPSSPDTSKARQLQRRAGTGKREQTTDLIKQDLAQSQFDSARARLDRIRELEFLPDNSDFTVRVDSLVTRKQLEYGLAAAKVAGSIPQFDSSFAMWPEMIPPLPAGIDSEHFWSPLPIDSLINAAMEKAMQTIRETERMRQRK